MVIPKKIDICPIVDSVVELRFESNIFPNAVFGLIFNSLKDEYPKVEKLPILQLPEQLRDADPNFKYKAHYKILSDDGYSVQIGSDVIVIGAPTPYPGWDKFSGKIYFVINEILKLNIIDRVIRLGLRLINFFDINIFDQVNLNISINEEPLNPTNTVLRTEIYKENFHNTLQIANNTTRIIDSKNVVGSIIDIDTFKNYSGTSFNSIFKNEIESAHNVEKEIFFSLLKEDFLNSLKPTY